MCLVMLENAQSLDVNQRERDPHHQGTNENRCSNCLGHRLGQGLHSSEDHQSPLLLGVPRALHLIYSAPLRYTLANNVDPLEPGLQRYEPWSYSYIVALQRTNTDRDRIQTTERLGHSILNKHAKGEVNSNTSQTECTDVETRERNLS